MNNPFSKMSGAEILAVGAKFVVAVVVIIFLGIQSINFFNFIFPADQQMFSMLGFGLTGGGVIAYLLILKFSAKSRLDKIIASIMLMVCILGELATAGFGMQVEALSKQGLSLTQSDLDAAIWAVRALGFVHAIALVAMVGGVEFAEAFDRDGVKPSNASAPTSASYTAPSFIPAPFPVPSNNKYQADFPYHPQGGLVTAPPAPSPEVDGEDTAPFLENEK
jgi:hypothetical protein